MTMSGTGGSIGVGRRSYRTGAGDRKTARVTAPVVGLLVAFGGLQWGNGGCLQQASDLEKPAPRSLQAAIRSENAFDPLTPQHPSEAPSSGSCPDVDCPLGCCPPGAACSTVSFAPAVNYPVGIPAKAIVSAHFMGLGPTPFDFAVASYGDMSLLLGAWDGTFQAGSAPQVPATDSVAAGDFDGDNLFDLVVASSYGSEVSVLPGLGDGTFALPIETSVGGEPDLITAGDFNGDGRLDLAVASQSDDTVRVLLGQGDGSFDELSTQSTGAEPVDLIARDFNGDGRPDLAVATEDHGVRIYLSESDGSLTTPVKYDVPAHPASPDAVPEGVTAGDFNGDGHLDLAVDGGTIIDVLIGNGDGSFQAAVMIDEDEVVSFLLAVDLDGDGLADLVIGESIHDQVTVRLSDGSGASFPLIGSFAVGDSPQAVVAGDFNRDGRIDLAVANRSSDDVSVLLRDGAAAGVRGCFNLGYIVPTCSDPAYPVLCFAPVDPGDEPENIVCGAHGTECSAEGTIVGSPDIPVPDGTSIAPDCGSGVTCAGPELACCPAGYSCTDDGCEVTFGPGPPPVDPPPPHLPDGWCPEGTSPTDATTCCADSHPLPCGDVCCLPGGACVGDDECTCPTGSAACGDLCCLPGMTCVDGSCQYDEPACPDIGFPHECRNFCCASDITCQDGFICECPSSHIDLCVGVSGVYYCCLEGASCNDEGCGCPSNRAECGEFCCGVGQICKDGECTEASPGQVGDPCTTATECEVDLICLIGLCAVPTGDVCWSDGDCAGFGIRNCGTADQAFCLSDGLCHCCYSDFGGCLACGACGADLVLLDCFDTPNCYWKAGGTPSQ